MSRYAVAGLVVCGLVGACSLFTDTGDLAGPPEAANDPSAVEGGSSADEASSLADGAAPPVVREASVLDCDAATFCDSFERAASQGPWERVTTLIGGTIAIDTTRGASGTSSLRIDLPAVDAGSAEANVRQEITRSPTGDLRVAFRLWTNGPPAREYHSVVLGMLAQKRYIFFTLRPTGLFLVEQDAPTNLNRAAQITNALPPGWHEVDFTLHGSSNVDVTFDGKAASPFALTYPLDASVLTLIAGVSFSGPGAPTTLWLDDVRFVR